MRILIPALTLLLTVACGGGTDPVTTVEDTAPDVGLEDTPTGGPDIEADLGAPDRGAPDVALLDTEPACEAGTGCFGDPCDDGGGCLSGICVPHMGDTVCTIECLEDCPDGWECLALNSGPDMIFACLSPYAHLCRPCTGQGDCATGTIEDACIDYAGEGSYCGADCSDDGLCPPGTSCVDAKTTAGVGLKQCVSDSGVCACSPLSVKLGLATPCGVTNDLGTCPGVRVCTAEGLAACDAAVPSEEVCDGLDNDCDGVTDDVACDDGNGCTADGCDPGVGCTHDALTGTSCDDGNVCSLADHCETGACVGTSIDCSDGNPCTTDACSPTGGCVYTFNTASCDDGDPCTVADQCKQGLCTGFDIDCDCDADVDCLALEDGNVCNGTLVCDAAVLPHECVVDPDTLIACSEPEGVDAPCLEAACHPLSGECSFTATNDGAPCEDGDLCTLGDQCVDGACVPGTPISSCNDGNPCTTDTCEAGEGCLFLPDDAAACDDLNPCTVGDHCTGGDCTFAGGLDCADDDVCTTDTCNPTSGCVHALNAAPCDDGDPCTTGDACALGDCVATGVFSCDDGNPCTDDACDALLGCVHTPSAGAAGCDDGNPCTTGDHCAAGFCVAAGIPDCDDGDLCTTDLCNPASGGCVHVLNQNPCDDGDVCTTGDFCHLGSCQGGPALPCDDGNPCTNDACNALTGCTFTPNAAPCDDGDPCTLVDTCAGGDCGGGALDACGDGSLCTDDSCVPGVGCANVPNTVPCDDADACTLVDVCAGGACVGTTPPSCEDANPCTDDACDADTGCVHVDNTAPCNDLNACTQVDTCAGGGCVGADPMVCDDGDKCTTDLCDPAQGCTITPISPCCGNGVTEGGEDCDDGNDIDGDGCSNACVAPWVAFHQYPHSGRTVYIFKSNPNAPLATYTSFCESKGLAWFTPKNQSDAQALISNAYALDGHHTWIITKNTTTAGTFGGYSVTVDEASCVAYSSSGFSAIRKWACSYCDPENHGVTKCWDSGHQYDWLVCEGT
ncbi:MAG: hypothetical protein ABIK09_12170 [Pseudomonadota bacterium]